MRKAVISWMVTGVLCGGASLAAVTLLQSCGGDGGSQSSSTSSSIQQLAADDTAPVYSGYSTGTDVFVDLLKNLLPGIDLANVNAGFSGAAVDTSGLKAFENEMSQAVVPQKLKGAGEPEITPFNSYGRGSGVELGLGINLPNNPDANQVIQAALAEQAATPPTPPGDSPDGSVFKILGPIPVEPLLYVGLVSGQAKAEYTTPQCTVDPDNLSFGRGDVAQVEVLNTAMLPLAPKLGEPNSQPLLSTTNTQPTDNTVSSTRSRVHLVPNGDSTTSFGLMSETTEEIAPVTLFKGTANELTIEVAGEWSLQALATGDASTSKLEYRPTVNGQDPTPTTPLITIRPPGSDAIVLKTQDLFGPGLIPQHIFIPPGAAGPHLAEISIGENPRAIGDDQNDNPAGPTISATEVSAAVDVVRVKLLSELQLPTDHVAEIRLGHMESKAVVSEGGVNCPPAGTPTPTVTGTPGTPTPTATETPGGGGTPTATPGGGDGGTPTATPGGGGGGGGTPTATPGGGGGTGIGGGTPTPTPGGIGGDGSGIGVGGLLETTGSGGCSLGGGPSSSTGSEMMPVLAIGLLLAGRQMRRRSSRAK